MPSSGSGGIVSAERHMANVAKMDIAFPLLMGGIFFAVIGLMLMIRSQFGQRRNSYTRRRR